METSFRQASAIVIAHGVVMAKEQGQNGVVKKCLRDSRAIGGSFVDEAELRLDDRRLYVVWVEYCAVVSNWLKTC